MIAQLAAYRDAEEQSTDNPNCTPHLGSRGYHALDQVMRLGAANCSPATYAAAMDFVMRLEGLQKLGEERGTQKKGKKPGPSTLDDMHSRRPTTHSEEAPSSSGSKRVE